jgi:hypothetical protein
VSVVRGQGSDQGLISDLMAGQEAEKREVLYLVLEWLENNADDLLSDGDEPEEGAEEDAEAA